MTSVSCASNALTALQTLATIQEPGQTTAEAATLRTATIFRSAAAAAQDVVSGANATQGLFAQVDGVGQALTAADAAHAAGQSVLGLLQQMRDAAGQASDPATPDTERARLGQQFQAHAAQIGPTLSGAAVNGVNLVDGSAGTGLKVALGDGSATTLSAANLGLGGPTLALPPDASVTTVTAASHAFSALGDALGATSAALATMRGQADQISAHAGFVQTLSQAAAAPQDDSADSVRLLALQVSQQLAGLSASVANASPSSVLSLFRS